VRIRILGSLLGLLCCAGLALCQEPPAEAALSVEPCVSFRDPVERRDPVRVWASADYLLWWMKKSPVPVPLVTSATDPTNPLSGNIGQSGTVTLLGSGGIDADEREGGRFTLGAWLDSNQTIGLEGAYLFLGQKTRTQQVSSTGSLANTTFGVPFVDVTIPGESFSSVALPTVTAGGATLSVSTRLQGAELNGVASLLSGRNLSLVLLGGVRYLQLEEKLQFDTTATGIPGGGFDGFFESTADQFNTRNRFWGGQLGVGAEYHLGRLFVNATGKVALGDMHQTVDIGGQTTLTPPTILGGPTTTTPGGFFALSTNSNHFSRDRFEVAPEVGVNVGVAITSWARLSVGYTFLYLNDVVRPGDQIDRSINPTQLPLVFGSAATLVGPSRPAFNFAESSFWAQGINFGLEFRY
jgi:Putative beta barrel porin-7 (BBP7)